MGNIARSRSSRAASVCVAAASCARRCGGALASLGAKSGSRLHSVARQSSNSASDMPSSCEAMRCRVCCACCVCVQGSCRQAAAAQAGQTEESSRGTGHVRVRCARVLAIVLGIMCCADALQHCCLASMSSRQVGLGCCFPASNSVLHPVTGNAQFLQACRRTAPPCTSTTLSTATANDHLLCLQQWLELNCFHSNCLLQLRSCSCCCCSPSRSAS